MSAGPLSRRTRLGVVVAVASVAALLVVGLVTRSVDRPAQTAPRSAPSRQSIEHPRPDGGFVWRTPATVAAPDTPLQRETDMAFLDAIGRQPGMASAVALAVPAPEVSGGWPSLPIEATAEGWAREFVTGLLDVDYAQLSRAALGPWLQANEAPALIPGVPESVADKMLYTSLVATEVFGGQPTPIPSASEWEANAQAGSRQWVSDLQIQVDPRWAELVASGWQPRDARMTTLDVSGLLTIRRGDDTGTDRFALQLLVGSARWRDGYGTVSVSDWRLGAG